MKSNLAAPALAVLLTALISFGVNTAFAFSEPSTSPPNSSAPTPLDTSANANTKVGGLILNTGGATNGLVVQTGNILASSGSLTTSKNVYVQTAASPSYVVFLGEFDQAVSDWPGKTLYGFGWQASSGAVGARIPAGATFKIYGAGGTANLASSGDLVVSGTSVLNGVTATSVSTTGNIYAAGTLSATGAISGGAGMTLSANINIAGCYQAAGTVVAGTCASDERLKENITPISGSLSKISALNPVTFNYIDPKYGTTDTQSGLVAQEVEKVYPEWVTTGADGFKSVRYDLDLQIQLIGAIKEQQKEIESLKAQVQALEAAR